jgi:protoporphyrinogen oxidase
MRAAVLGAGVCGLAAAYRLLQIKPDWEVLVFEQEDHAGGLAAGWRNEQFRADLGPHRVFTELPEIEKLLPELIAKEQMITVQRRSELLLRGHFYRYPVRVTELLRVMGPWTTARLAFSAVKGKLSSPSNPANYESAMVGNFGRGVYDLIIKPYTRKVWKIDPARLSAEIARVRVSAGNASRLMKGMLRKKDAPNPTALSQFSYIRGGVEGLVKSLEEKVHAAGGHVEFDQKVTGFSGSGGHISEVLTRSGKNRGRVPVDFVLSTIPITDLVAMLQPIHGDMTASQAAGGLTYVGLILVAFVIKRPQFTQNTWIYFPEEKYLFNRCYEPRNFDPSMAPADSTMAVFEITANWDSETWLSGDDQLIAEARRNLLDTGLVAGDDIAEAFAVRVPYTYPLYTADFQQRLDTVFDYLRLFDNLISTGRQGLFNHNNMDHSMLMGIRGAEYLQRGDKPALSWYNDLGQFSHFRIVD